MSRSTLSLPSSHRAAVCPQCETRGLLIQRLREERDALAIRVRELTPQTPSHRGLYEDPLSDGDQFMRETGQRPSSREGDLPRRRRHTPVGYPATDDVVVAPGLANAIPSHTVSAAGQGIDFGAVSRLSESELDALPYGLVTLDSEGRVLSYNDTESRLARFPKDRVIGRDFFREVAPCTRVRAFEGRFRALAADPVGVRVQTFDFVFRFDHSEQHVSIVITPARRRGCFHVAMLRRAIIGA